MEEWRFVLVGDKFDIQGIAELFSEQGTIAEDEHGQVVLTLHLAFACEQYVAAKDAAEALLAKMNAAAQIIHGNHENVHIGAYGHLDSETERLQYFLHLHDSVRSRARLGVGGAVFNAGGGPLNQLKRIGDQILDAAVGNEHLQRALYLYGSVPLDWRGLYLVLEAAEDGNGGEKGLIGKNWVPDGQIKDFKNTANSYKALGRAARHGSIAQGTAAPKLTEDQAREMVRTILDKWTKEHLQA